MRADRFVAVSTAIASLALGSACSSNKPAESPRPVPVPSPSEMGARAPEPDAPLGSAQQALPAQQRGACPANMARFDVDGDGRVTREELQISPTSAEAQAHFSAHDRDGDGVLSADEWCPCAHAPGQPCPHHGAAGVPPSDVQPTSGQSGHGAHGHGHGAHGHGHGAHGQGAMGPGTMEPGTMGRGMRASCDERFQYFDANGDGHISLEEFSAFRHRRGDAGTLFGLRDRDKDGKLTKDELCVPPTPGAPTRATPGE